MTTETLVVVSMELSPLEFLDLMPDDGTAQFFLPHLLECSQRKLLTWGGGAYEGAGPRAGPTGGSPQMDMVAGEDERVETYQWVWLDVVPLMAVHHQVCSYYIYPIEVMGDGVLDCLGLNQDHVLNYWLFWTITVLQNQEDY